jgi:hypothetical protein
MAVRKSSEAIPNPIAANRRHVPNRRGLWAAGAEKTSKMQSALAMYMKTKDN